MALFARLIGEADFGPRADSAKAVTLLAWIVNGFNEAFRATIATDVDPEAALVRYEQGLREYLSVVSPCLTGLGVTPLQKGEAQ